MKQIPATLINIQKQKQNAHLFDFDKISKKEKYWKNIKQHVNKK